MTKPSLLILGGALYQLNAISGGRSLGFRVVTADNRPDNPGHTIADASFNVDTTDGPGILRIAKSEQVSGILSPGTDVAVLTAALVAAELELIGPPVGAALVCTDKSSFRRFQHRIGVPAPWIQSIVADNVDHIQTTEGVVIVKPNQSSGSKGTRVVQSKQELRKTIEVACSYSLDGKAIVEEYISGLQGTIEGFIEDGKLIWSVIFDRETALMPYVATYGHRYPTRLSPERQGRLIDQVTRLCRLLGVSSGPVDCDFVSTEKNDVILEMTPRLGGNSISKLCELSGMGNLIRTTIEWASGHKSSGWPALCKPTSATAVVLLGSPHSGRLWYNASEERALRATDWVMDIEWEREIGESVNAFIDGRHRCGAAFIHATCRDELDKRINELRSRLGVSTR